MHYTKRSTLPIVELVQVVRFLKDGKLGQWELIADWWTSSLRVHYRIRNRNNIDIVVIAYWDNEGQLIVSTDVSLCDLDVLEVTQRLCTHGSVDCNIALT